MKLNPNVQYSSNFLGFVPNNSEMADTIIALIRDTIKGTGFYLKVRGRHPNRRQFVRVTGYTHAELRQDMPVKYATTLALYVQKRSDLNLMVKRNGVWMTRYGYTEAMVVQRIANALVRITKCHRNVLKVSSWKSLPDLVTLLGKQA